MPYDILTHVTPAPLSIQNHFYPMYIIPIGWLYVVVMMSVAEATNSNGTVLGAVFIFLFYGVLPVSLILYFMGAPGRKRAIRRQEAAEQALRQPDASGHAATDPVAPVREEP